MSINEKLRKFAERHRICVVDTNKRAHKYHKVNIQYFKDPADYNHVYENIVYDSEPLYTVEIAESELEKIAEFEDQVFNHMGQHGHYNMFETLMEQKEHEKYLKEKYPAVKKAYEQYSMMLKMAQSGEL
jgi:hypothetical protein